LIDDGNQIFSFVFNCCFIFCLGVHKKESITTIENLPNELFYQIFFYLTNGELFSSFCLLTKDGHFDELIRKRTSINLWSIRRLEFLENKCLINSKILREIYLFNDDDTRRIIN
jgi:hypothetical protein